MNNIKINRKKFLKYAAAATVIPFIVIWDKVVERVIKLSSLNSKIILPSEIPAGVTFQKSLIINKNNAGLNIYSSKCTHLGCRINKIEDKKLICPCHGSQFDLYGNVVKGPAAASLKQLDYKTDPKTKEIVVLDV